MLTSKPKLWYSVDVLCGVRAEREPQPSGARADLVYYRTAHLGQYVRQGALAHSHLTCRTKWVFHFQPIAARRAYYRSERAKSQRGITLVTTTAECIQPQTAEQPAFCPNCQQPLEQIVQVFDYHNTRTGVRVHKEIPLGTCKDAACPMCEATLSLADLTDADTLHRWGAEYRYSPIDGLAVTA